MRRSRTEMREGIVETATRLFSSLGYDATPLHMIADAAGLDIGTVNDLMGDKRGIYLQVMERAYLLLKASQDEGFARFTRDQAGVRLLVEHHLSFCMEHPEVPELWMHRWLSDAADVTEVEIRYLKPILDRVVDELQDLVAPNVDLGDALWTLIWCIRGFVVGGILTPGGEITGPRDPEALRQFRTHLNLLVDRMFGPGG